MHYVAYGLRLSSELPLPELEARPGDLADVRVRFGRLDVCAETPATFEYVAAGPRGVYLTSKRFGTISVSDGREVILDLVSNVDENVVRLVLLGAAMAVLLHQRGHLVLHASAVAVDGQAVIFLGGKGWGKSTLAAQLCVRGHELLADDVVALDLTQTGRPVALPSYPQLKLWPDAMQDALGDDPAQVPEIAPGAVKRAHPAAHFFAGGPRSVTSIWALDEGPALRVRRLSPPDTVLGLVYHSYLARFGPAALGLDGSACNLRQCATLASAALGYRLERPRALNRLDDVARLVETHVREGVAENRQSTAAVSSVPERR